jgi:hypothetical protein
MEHTIINLDVRPHTLQHTHQKVYVGRGACGEIGTTCDPAVALGRLIEALMEGTPSDG